MKSSFIPKPYRKEPITVRVEVEKLEVIDKLSIKYNTNRSEFINRCIDFALDNMSKEGK